MGSGSELKEKVEFKLVEDIINASIDQLENKINLLEQNLNKLINMENRIYNLEEIALNSGFAQKVVKGNQTKVVSIRKRKDEW